MFSIGSIVQIIVRLLIFFAIVGILYYIIGVVPIPAPFKEWTFTALKVLAALAVIGMLLDWSGWYPLKRDPPA